MVGNGQEPVLMMQDLSNELQIQNIYKKAKKFQILDYIYPHEIPFNTPVEAGDVYPIFQPVFIARLFLLQPNMLNIYLKNEKFAW